MIQFISHFTEQHTYLDSIRLALEGGIKWVQLRMKESSEEEFLSVGTEVRRLCNQYGATFIIDDHVELVHKLKADGVHLGKNDMPIIEARRILGNNVIIGGTANTFEDIASHYQATANYIGCGPFRFTTTKRNLSPILGMEGYTDIVSHMKAEGINLPIVAIGGITKEDIPTLIQTGITGIAISGSILRAENPIEEMKEIIKKITLWKN